MIKISVIIPIYNVEKYLRKCLDSVCNQTFKDIEIICVNDCSPDNCFHILNEYKEKDNRIKILNREQNGGLSAARNSGIDFASGEYIYFLDSDDWIDLDYLEVMYKAAVENDVEIVANDNIISEKINKSIPYQHAPTKTVETNTLFKQNPNVYDIICNVWSKLYKRSFIQKYSLKFPEGYINEDLYFHYISFVNAEKIFFIRESNHHYLDRTDGIMNTITDKDFPILKIYDLIYDYYLEHDLLDRKIKIFSIMPHFKVESEEKYNLFKAYFIKIDNYMKSNESLFNDLEHFFVNNILNTTDYEDYKSKFPISVTISYIRRKK